MQEKISINTEIENKLRKNNHKTRTSHEEKLINARTTQAQLKLKKQGHSIDSYLEDFEIIESPAKRKISDNSLDFHDFESVGNSEKSEEAILSIDEYAPRIKWNVNKGMNHQRMHKLYSLLTDQKSNFHLTKLTCKQSESTKKSYTFESKINNNQVVLFKPGFMQATYSSSNQDRDSGGLSHDLTDALTSMKNTCDKLETPTRFVIPINEKPIESQQGSEHSVLLVVDYDPRENSITPRVVDSIGRNTFADNYCRYWYSNDQSTADVILNDKIQEIFKHSSTGVKTEKIKRLAYNHQNRATEGNCGAYTFVSIYYTIQSFIDGKTWQEFARNIPKPGFITSDSYLNKNLKKEVEACINYRNKCSKEIDAALQSIDNTQSNRDGLKEFEVALKQYKFTNEKEAKKFQFNLFGYTKDKKKAAVESLLTIIQLIQKEKYVSFELYEQIVKYKAELSNGRLGMLTQFHLQQLQYKSINHLISSSKRNRDYEEVDTFVVIPKM